MCDRDSPRRYVVVAQSGWGNGKVNGDAVRERVLGWNDVIGNREEASCLGNARASPLLLCTHTHTHTYVLSGTIHAELHAPPVTRPHFPLPINPDLSYKQQEGVEEEGGSSLNH